MASADGIDHALHLSADRFFFLGRQAVVARVDHLGVGLNAQPRVLIGVVQDPALSLRDAVSTEFRRRQLVTPITEGALREFHDVALVHQGHVALFAFHPQGVLDRLTDMALAAVLADGLDADA